MARGRRLPSGRILGHGLAEETRQGRAGRGPLGLLVQHCVDQGQRPLHRREGRLAEAATALESALEAHRDAEDRYFEAASQATLGTVLAEAGDIDAVEQAFERDGDIAAVILEPTGASSGQIPVDGAFLEGLRRVTAARGAAAAELQLAEQARAWLGLG